MKVSERLVSFTAARFFPWQAACVGLVVLVCCLAPHASAAEPAAFVYRNPSLLVTKGSATITDLAGARKTVQSLANDYAEEQKPAADQPLPCVAVLSGGQLVETSADGAATIFDPAVGMVLLRENASVRVSPALDQPKAGIVQPNASGVGSSLELLKGRLSIRIDGEKLRKANNSTEFRLRMPKNILAVRGTEFTAIQEGETSGVIMSKGAVALQSIDGKAIALLDLKKSKPTLYRIDAQGMISGSEEYKDTSSLMMPQDFLEAEPNLQKRKITLRHKDSGRQGGINMNEPVPAHLIDWSELKPPDAEGVVRWVYHKPGTYIHTHKDSLPIFTLSIELPDRFRTSPTGLLLKVKSSVKIEGAMLRASLINENKRGSGAAREPQLYDANIGAVQLGGIDGWQAYYLPLTKKTARVFDSMKSALCLDLKSSMAPNAFEMDVAPVFLTVSQEPAK